MEKLPSTSLPAFARSEQNSQIDRLRRRILGPEPASSFGARERNALIGRRSLFETWSFGRSVLLRRTPEFAHRVRVGPARRPAGDPYRGQRGPRGARAAWPARWRYLPRRWKRPYRTGYDVVIASISVNRSPWEIESVERIMPGGGRPGEIGPFDLLRRYSGRCPDPGPVPTLRDTRAAQSGGPRRAARLSPQAI